MKYTAFYIVFLLFTVETVGQFRGHEPRNPAVREGIVRESGDFLFSLLDHERFQMRHSVSMSYMNLGGQSIGLTMYTNSLYYRIADPLSVRADISMVYSPFNSFGNSFQKQINGIYIQRAQVDYHPSRNLHISLQYRNVPFLYPYNGLNRGYHGLWGIYGDDGY